jgi:hypothetical protein
MKDTWLENFTKTDHKNLWLKFSIKDIALEESFNKRIVLKQTVEM